MKTIRASLTPNDLSAISTTIRTFLGTAAICSAFAVAACSGGGGGGGSGDPVILEISVQGMAAPIYGGPPSPAGEAFLNGRIDFLAGGPIDPASLPADGTTNSKIRIFASSGGSSAAMGRWRVSPTDPRRFSFEAYSPNLGGPPCTAGLIADTVYALVIDATGSAATSLVIAGLPVRTPVFVTFPTRACSPSNTAGAFSDPAFEILPTIVATSPAMSAAAPTTDGSTILSGNVSVLTLDIAKPLDPNQVFLGGLRLFDVTATPPLEIPIAVSIAFQQTGFVLGVTDERSRLVLTTSARLAGGRTYEVRTDPISAPRDFSGNAVEVGAGTLRFQIAAENLADFLSTDSFDSTANRQATGGNIAWNGNGVVAATPPTQYVGTGADGVGAFTTNVSLNTNVNQGTFNFTSLVIGSASVPVIISLTSPTNDPTTATSCWPASFFSLSTIDILTNTQFLAGGRQGANGAANSATTPELGGFGGPGGGRGGVASPSMTQVDLAGESGQGSIFQCEPINASGGGFGGTSGPVGTFGPSGGGGGSASHASTRLGLAGEPQQGSDGAGTGAPPGGAAGPLSPLFLPPLSGPIGGTGGGAGGDRIDAGGIAQHDTGGAGGGGGGGLLFSAADDITVGTFVQFMTNGGNGGAATGFLVAKGGGGSGGSLLIRSFSDVTLGLGNQLHCGGGAPSAGNPTPVNPPASPADGDGGKGGDGVVQLEDLDGVIPNLSTSIVIGELFSQASGLTGTIDGTALSVPVDTGSNGVEYLAVNGLGATGAAFVAGASGSVIVDVIGIAEDPLAPGQPALNDPALQSPPALLGDIASLTGYRWFMVRVRTSYPAPPTFITVYPGVESVTVAYRR